MRTLGWRLTAVLAALAVVAAACSGDDDTASDDGGTTTTTQATTTTAGAADDGGDEGDGGAAAPVFDIGVTTEPCPDGDPSRGCIYLGTITDETGVFAPASPGLVAGNQAFWARVNAEGGVGGLFDVSVPDEFKVNNDYTPATHAQVYQEINDEVLAIVQSVGTSQSLAAIEDMIADNMVVAPTTWWSGWAFPDQDGGLVVESGANYCVEAMNAVDFAVSQIQPATVGIIYIPNDYGTDYAAGVRAAAVANNLEVVADVPTPSGAENQGDAITAVLSQSPDVTFIVTGPFEAAAIIGNSAAQQHQKPFIGAAPTWNAAILATAAGPAFEALYFQSSPWGPWAADTPGHAAMRSAAEAVGEPPSAFFSAGWVLQYPLKAALENAVANGDLTRAGLAAAAQSLESVDYEGMLPEGAGNYSAAGEGSIVTQSLINSINSDTAVAPDGAVIAQDLFAGPSVMGYDFSTGPCAVAGG